MLTEGAQYSWKRSHFRTANDDEEEEGTGRTEEETGGGRTRSTRGQLKADQATQRASREQEMGQRQYERMMRKKEVGTKQGVKDGAAGGETTGEQKSKLVSTYDSAKELPTSETLKRDRIHLDTRRECVLLPLGDRLVPFHVSTIKTVSKLEEKEVSTIRFNFHFPTTTTAAQFKELPPEMSTALELFPQLAYLKELSFKSKDVSTVDKLVKSVRDLAKRTKEKLKRASDEENLVSQADLIVLKERSKEKPATLVDVSLQPTFSAKSSALARCVGRLRAHVNGFRFQTERSEVVDVLYPNIKYFFFMRGERELKVCIHFYLKNPIMVGKKKTRHLQFFTEVQEGSSDLRGRGGGYDPDELEDEDRQRKLIAKLNRTFGQFCKQSMEIASANGYDLDELELVNKDEAQRQRGFLGMPHKEMVLIQPTAHCLVNLSEKDPFVLSVDEVEHIHFQRLSIGRLRAFDIIFILKTQVALDRSGDNLKVVRIENVPIEKLDEVRDWIDSHDELTYTAGEPSLKWDMVLDGVRYEMDQGVFWSDTDAEGNHKDVGWLFLNPSSLESSSEEDEDDSVFTESGDDDDEDDDGEDSDDSDDSLESEVDEDDDDDMEVADSDDEGEDWDEMEKKAEKADRNSRFDRSEGDAPKKKKHRKG